MLPDYKLYIQESIPCLQRQDTAAAIWLLGRFLHIYFIQQILIMEHTAINPAAFSHRAVTPHGRALSFTAVNSELAPIKYITISLIFWGGFSDGRNNDAFSTCQPFTSSNVALHLFYGVSCLKGIIFLV